MSNSLLLFHNQGHGRPIGKPEGWIPVTPPSGWDWVLPFTIQQNGRSFRPDPSFDLRTYAGISVTKTYYVDSVNGLDSNDGLSWGNAKKTLANVYSQGDYDRIYIAENSYFYKTERPTLWARNVEIIGVGPNIKITSCVDNQMTGGWSNVTGSVWVRNIGEYVGMVKDYSNIDSYGYPTILKEKSSVAQVAAVANSYYTDWPNTDLYVRTFDNREPDGDIHGYDTRALNQISDNRTVYFENVYFETAITVANLTAAGGMKAYLKDCTVNYATMLGASEVIFWNCLINCVGNSGIDGINADIRNAILNKHIEYNCTVFKGGIGSTDQLSTAHNGSYVVRIMGDYRDTGGQIFAEASNSKSWNLGVIAQNSAINVMFYVQSSNGRIWLDSCTVINSGTDIQADSSSIAYVRNFLPTAYTKLGTVLPY